MAGGFVERHSGEIGAQLGLRTFAAVRVVHGFLVVGLVRPEGGRRLRLVQWSSGGCSGRLTLRIRYIALRQRDTYGYRPESKLRRGLTSSRSWSKDSEIFSRIESAMRARVPPRSAASASMGFSPR